MTAFTLHRAFSGPGGTFGVLARDSWPLCVTLENPWLDNKPGESCVPPGRYRCVPHSGPRFRDVWELTGVPGRSAILIHTGNSVRDTRGCLLVGKSFAALDGLPAVTESVATLNMLRKTLPAEFWLTIIEGGPS